MTERKWRIAVVGTTGGWSSELLADRCNERTGFRLIVDLEKIVANFNTGEVTCDGQDLCQLDAIVIKKLGKNYSPRMLDRLEILRFLAHRGVRIFSNPQSIALLIDRLSCTTTLRCAGIPMPETAVTEHPAEAERVVRHFGAAVLKPLYSTKAQGMVILQGDDPELTQKIAAFAELNPVMYIQRRLESIERDLGVVFLGGEYVGSYSRVKAPGAWNTTTAAGGRYAAHEVSHEVIELARRAQALFKMDLTSVDVVETRVGPAIFEVSAFGGFRGLLEVSGVDLGARYADYVIRRLQQ